MKRREQQDNILRKNFTRRINYIFLVVVFLVYLSGQLYIGAYHPLKKIYRLDAIFHMDFLNYASILKQFFSSFPPPNPNFAGVPLTQSWLHHIPGAMVSQFISPILSIRIFNLLWIIAFILILRRYFPSEYGLLAFLLLCLSTPGWQENPLSLDLIIRSFHHTPFFLFLVIAFFEKNKTLRYLAAFLLPWVHGLLALAILPFFILEAISGKDREQLCFLLFLTLGIYTYSALFTTFAAEGPISFLRQKIFFKPREPLTHILPFMPFLLFCQEKRWWRMGVVGFVLSSLIQWNNYYFIFILNVAIVLALIEALKYLPPLLKRSLGVVVIICFVFFVNDLLHKYDPLAEADPYRVCLDYEFRPALDWISKNTGSQDVFLIYPPDNLQDIPFVQKIRQVYLGWDGYAETLGLSAKKRKEAAISFYRGSEIAPGISYIFYGPLEKRHFPEFPKLNYRLVYNDKFVNIYKSEKSLREDL